MGHIANPFRIEGLDKLLSQPGVFKMNFGKKFFIYKGKSVHLSVDIFSKQIDREIRNPKSTSILVKVVAYLKRYPVTSASIDVLMYTEDPVELLLAENEALQANKENKDCLNISFDNTAYVPQWIPQKDVVAYKRKLEGKRMQSKVPKDVHFKNYLNKMKLSAKKVDQIFEYVKARYR